MFPENFDWLNLIQSPKVPSDGMFYLWPTWLTSMFLGHFVHHLHQAEQQEQYIHKTPWNLR